jgi:hypothetical protein
VSDSLNAAISSPLRTSRTSPDEHRVVPGLALDPLEAYKLCELVRGRPDQRQLTFLRQYQQHVLVGQQQELTVAIASALVFATVPPNFDDFRAEPEQFIDAGEHVVVVGRFRGKAISGATLDAPFVHVHRMRNGKVIRFQNYVDATPWTKAWSG